MASVERGGAMGRARREMAAGSRVTPPVRDRPPCACRSPPGLLRTARSRLLPPRCRTVRPRSKDRV